MMATYWRNCSHQIDLRYTSSSKIRNKVFLQSLIALSHDRLSNISCLKSPYHKLKSLGSPSAESVFKGTRGSNPES